MHVKIQLVSLVMVILSCSLRVASAQPIAALPPLAAGSCDREPKKIKLSNRARARQPPRTKLWLAIFRLDLHLGPTVQWRHLLQLILMT